MEKQTNSHNTLLYGIRCSARNTCERNVLQHVALSSDCIVAAVIERQTPIGRTSSLSHMLASPTIFVYQLFRALLVLFVRER